MSTVIAIHWTQPTLHFVVARDGMIAASASIPAEPGTEPAVIGQRLAEALEPHSPGRAKLIVAISRGDLDWQHLSLPPCPADELPDVVQLQADRDVGAPGDDLGFDFLPLVGDEQTPYQVLTVALPASELDKIRGVSRAANLTLERIVPLSAGWPAITGQIASNTKPGTQVYVAPQAGEALLWATRAGKVVLFRQFQLAAERDAATVAAAVNSEVRRTLLALSQQSNSGKPAVSLVGHQPNELADLTRTLDEQLDLAVSSLDVSQQHPSLTNAESIATSALPLAGLAIDEAQGLQPLIDLLHPRQRPQKQANIRTYALAAAAGILSIVLFGWLSYAKLQAPLNQAGMDQAELTLLKEPLDQLGEYEQRAAAIRDWTAEAPNLLIHLQQVSKCLRPQPLDAEAYPGDQDVVLENLGIEKRKLTIDALASSSRAVQPLEARLRASGYRPQRGKSDPSQTIKNYAWHFKSSIDITSASDNASLTEKVSDSDNKAPTQEPQT